MSPCPGCRSLHRTAHAGAWVTWCTCPEVSAKLCSLIGFRAYLLNERRAPVCAQVQICTQKNPSHRVPGTFSFGGEQPHRRPENSGLAAPVPGTMQASSGMVALLASVVRRCKHAR